MKTEEKELVVKWLDKFQEYFYKPTPLCIDEIFNQFKADNDLIVKDELEFGRWIVCDEPVDTLWMVFFDNVKKIKYGTDSNGDWFCKTLNLNQNFDPQNRYATDEEILERLSKIAEKMGYVEGVEVEDACTGSKSKLIRKYILMDEGLGFGGTWILYNGKWAKIISTPNCELSQEEWNERVNGGTKEAPTYEHELTFKGGKIVDSKFVRINTGYEKTCKEAIKEWANERLLTPYYDSIDKHIEAITKQGYLVTLEKK